MAEVEDLSTQKPKLGKAAAGGPSIAVAERSEEDWVEPTESGKIRFKRPAAPSKGAKGADLLPDLTGAEEVYTRTMWVGLLPHCPAGIAYVAGFDIPKVERPEREAFGQYERTHTYGKVHRFTDKQWETFKRTLPLYVVRADPSFTWGQVLRLPESEEMAKVWAERGQQFIPNANDEGLASYLWCVEQDYCGGSYPAPVVETGLPD